MNLVQPDLSTAHVSACETKVSHPGHGQLAQVAVFDSGRDEWHGNVPANDED